MPHGPENRPAPGSKHTEKLARLFSYIDEVISCSEENSIYINSNDNYLIGDVLLHEKIIQAYKDAGWKYVLFSSNRINGWYLVLATELSFDEKYMLGII